MSQVNVEDCGGAFHGTLLGLSLGEGDWGASTLAENQMAKDDSMRRPYSKMVQRF